MDKINKETDIHVRTTVKQKQAFEAKLKSNAQYKSGAITLFIDAYIANPVQTIEALTRIKNS
jgi:hypothetical protein